MEELDKRISEIVRFTGKMAEILEGIFHKRYSKSTIPSIREMFQKRYP